jgi:hypothetical protein
MALEQAIEELNGSILALIQALEKHAAPAGSDDDDEASKAAAKPAKSAARKSSTPDEPGKKVDPPTRRKPKSDKGESESPLTKEDVRAALVKVQEKLGSSSVVSVLEEFGAASISKLDPGVYPEVIRAADRLLAGDE